MLIPAPTDASSAGTVVSGELPASARWTANQGPYLVTDVLTVPPGAELSIGPGAVVKLSKQASMRIEGRLLARGALGDEVVFTTLADNRFGGDTNSSEESANGTAENQTSIQVMPGGEASLVQTLIYMNGTTVAEGSPYALREAAVQNHGGILTISDARFDHLLGSAVSQSAGTSTLARLTFGTNPAHLSHLDIEAQGGSMRIDDTVLVHGFAMRDTDLALSTSATLEVNEFSGGTLTDAGGNVAPFRMAIPSMVREYEHLLPYPFVYSGTNSRVLEDGELFIPPGAVVRGGVTFDVLGSLSIGDGTPALSIFVPWNSPLGPDGGSFTGAPKPGEGTLVIARPGARVSIRNAEFWQGGRDGFSLHDGAPCGTLPAERRQCAGTITNLGGNVLIEDSRFEDSASSHMLQLSGSTQISRSRLKGAISAVRVLGGSLSISGSSITDVSSYGVLESGFAVEARGNWWGDALGPGPNRIPVSAHVAAAPWLPRDPFAIGETPCSGTCPSNVLFLPGIKGSRLYDSEGRKLWEPFGNHDIEALMLDETGSSLDGGVRTAPEEIVDRIAGVIDIYGSFAEFMDKLVIEGALPGWQPAAYDWRLSLPDIVTPSLKQQLRALAAASPSGKAVIVAHSNGGLVAKELLRAIGKTEAEALVEAIVLIGVPHLGAPQALAALLYGYKEGLPWWFPGIVSTAAARTFAENAPMAYHLLPSETYLDAMSDAAPIVTFGTGAAHAKERDAYGEAIDVSEELRAFMLAEEGGRQRPLPRRTDQANVLNPFLITYGQHVHEALDTWTPPEGIAAYELAGIGMETMTGIEYGERCALGICTPRYLPTFAFDGDGVVPRASAHAIAGSERFAVDLSQHGWGPFGSKDHGTLLTLPVVQELVRRVATGEGAGDLFASRTAHAAGSIERLRLFFPSSLTFAVQRADGARIMRSADGTEAREIPGATTGMIGNVQYVTLPADTAYALLIETETAAELSLEIDTLDGTARASRTAFEPAVLAAAGSAQLELVPGLVQLSPLLADTDGDGTIDRTLPRIGSEPAIEPSLTDEASERTKGSSRGRGGSAPDHDAPLEHALEAQLITLYETLLDLLRTYLALLSERSAR